LSFPPPPTTATYPLSLHDALPISFSQSGGHRPWHFGFRLNNLSTHFLNRCLHFLLPGYRHCSTLLGLCLGYPLIRLGLVGLELGDRKSTRLNSSHVKISYAVFCLK